MVLFFAYGSMKRTTNKRISRGTANKKTMLPALVFAPITGGSWETTALVACIKKVQSALALPRTT